MAYGRILPQSVLDLPKYGCLNVHASLLPKYRGAAPIQWTVLNGDPIAGVTVQQMDAGMDTGDMLSKASMAVEPTDTTGTLFEKWPIWAPSCWSRRWKMWKKARSPERNKMKTQLLMRRCWAKRMKRWIGSVLLRSCMIKYGDCLQRLAPILGGRDSGSRSGAPNKRCAGRQPGTGADRRDQPGLFCRLYR